MGLWRWLYEMTGLDKAPSNAASRVIAVLGMHRSGTSCLTGMLENAGIPLGSVSRRNPYNKKGNNENLSIVSLHDGVLADNGAAWDAPPAAGCEWSAQRLEQLDAIIAEYGHLSRWAFKDPRSLFALEGWIERVPRLEFVGSFRHPVAVVRSLMWRAGIEGGFEQQLELWAAYNRRLMQFQDHFGFDLVPFDLEPEAYVERVHACFRRLGLQPERDALTFFDTGLRNQDANDERLLPAHIATLYRELLERAA